MMFQIYICLFFSVCFVYIFCLFNSMWLKQYDMSHTQIKNWTQGIYNSPFYGFQGRWLCSNRDSYVQYIPRNMHTVFALLCFVVVIHWLIFPYPSGLLNWHCGNLTIAPVPAKHISWDIMYDQNWQVPSYLGTPLSRQAFNHLHGFAIYFDVKCWNWEC